MVKALVSVVFFGSIAGLGAVWLTVPVFAGYLVTHKLKRGCYRSPFNWIDVMTLLMLGYVLMATWRAFPDAHYAKGMCNLTNELAGLGVCFSILLCARVPLIWKHPEWRLSFSLLTAVLMVLISVLVGALVPPTGGC